MSDCSSEKLTASTKALPVRLFMGAGGLQPDPMLPDMADMAARLMGRGYESFEMMTRVFADETHTSVWPASASRGLRYTVATG